ncbi:hypothetical protein ACQ4WX_17355 [Streptomyces lasalocidi]
MDGAAEAAHDALSLAGQATSGRARTRLTALRHRFQRYDNRAARDVVQRAGDLLSARPQVSAS